MAAAGPQTVRIFLSSPSDVAEERRLAAALIEQKLAKDPGLVAAGCRLELVRWDDPDAPTPMEAERDAQSSVDWAKGKPSDCNLVIVMLWARLGSPFKRDGRSWASGTEYEYEDARSASPQPSILVYHRTEEPMISLRDPDYAAKVAQLQAVDGFLARLKAHTSYAAPEAFAVRLEQDLRKWLADRVPANRSQGPFASTLLDRFGIAPLAPAAFRIGAENFLKSYLVGSPEHPVAFGGRAAMLDRLDSWLTDPDAPHRLLLWAPAGRGKSALLVRWLDRLGAASCHPVFLPISIRFSTNRAELFHHALAARLAALLGTDLPAATLDPVAHYRGFAIDLLRRAGELDRLLLLVVDGLDEAVWHLDEWLLLLPHDPPSHLRILVSARLQLDDTDGGGWLSRLAWDQLGPTPADLQVKPLDDAGIADVLDHLPAASSALAAEPGIAAELARLTGGDPLLVGLYGEDIINRSAKGLPVTRAWLTALEPGFGPYFKRWLNEQEKLWQATGVAVERTTVKLLISILACALGPLSHADLADLCRLLLRDEGFTLPREALEPIERFLYGDGNRQGYSLSHPKLGDYFRSKYFRDPAIVKAARDAFLAWGRATVDRLNVGRLAPADCPSYLLLYHRQHLEAADAPCEAFMALVENGWRLAREQLEGGPSGFAGDVAAALRHARQDLAACPGSPSGPALAAQLRCCLILASLRNVGGNIPPQLLMAAARKGVLSRQQAFYFGRAGGAEPFCAVVSGLATFLTDDERPGVIAEALAAARAIGHEGSRAWALAGLAGQLSGPQLAEALAIARAIGDAGSRARALAGLAGQLSDGERPGVVAEALAAARAIGDPRARAQALAGLAGQLSGPQLAEALAIARAIGSEDACAQALAGLAGQLSGPQLAEALAIARAIGDAGSRARALAGLAGQLSDGERPGVVAEALAATRAIGHEGSRARALAGLAGQLSGPQLAEALAIARAIGDADARARALAGLAGQLSDGERPGVVAEALAAARAIGDAGSRARALTGLAGQLSDGERPGVVAEALAAARAIGDAGSRARALAGLAGRLSDGERPGVVVEALAAARAIGDADARAEALTGLVERLSDGERPGVVAEALAAARAIGDAGSRARALADLAGQLSGPQLAEALAAARAIGDAGSRARALTGLAGQLSDDERPGVVAEALAAARAIGDPRARAQALAGLAGQLSGPQLAEALAIARAIGGAGSRARALAGLAGQLSDGERPGVVAEALAAARAIGDPRARARALAGLAGQLSGPQLAEALAAARAIDDAGIRAQALAGLAGQLSEDERPGVMAEALAAARAIGNEDSRARALADLAGQLSGPQLAEALAAARAIGDEDARARALAGLAGQLSEDERPGVMAEALAAARAIGDEFWRARALAGLAGQLSGPQLALAAARAIGDEDSRAWALADLAGQLSGPQLAEALAEARAIGDEDARARALAGLAGQLSGPQLAEALAAARAIGNEGYRAAALAGLVPHLAIGWSDQAFAGLLSLADRLPRSRLLSALTPFLPVLARLGGVGTLRELHRAIRDTASWYP